MTGAGRTPRLRLFLRGSFHFERPDGQGIIVSRKRSKGLLALLALSENGVRDRRWVQDKLWSGSDQDRGSASLRQELRYLRQLQEELGTTFLNIQPDSVRLDFDRVAVDVRIRSIAPDGQELLEGLDIDDPEFEDWLRTERTRQDERNVELINTHTRPMDETRSHHARPRLYVADFEALGGTEAPHDFASGLKNELLISLGSLAGTFEVTDAQPEQRDHRAYELVGSVRHADGIRVIARLLQLPERTNIWSSRYDREARNAFLIQEDISRQVVEAVQSHLVDGEMVGIWSRYTTSLEAWELYQAGRRCEAQHSRSGHIQARAMYDRALAVDPDFVPAKIVSVFINIDEVRLGWAVDPEATFAATRKMHRRLVEQHADEPYVHILGVYIGCLSGDHETASRQMAAIMHDLPDSPELKSYHALILEANDEVPAAIAMYREALTLTPYPPNWIRTNLALAYLVADDSMAEPTLDMALANDEKSVRAHVGKVVALVRRGELIKAQAWARALKSLQPEFTAATWRNERFYKNPLPIRRIVDELRQAGL
ncbi:MAG: hypothetical protein KDK08_27045 [Rhizobiaceae bacterium]|nr:hypothetical protein [Rhizobiaceae bacterium]